MAEKSEDEKRKDAERERILREIDAFTGPSKMSKDEAFDWLADLHADIEGRLDALDEELGEEEEEEEEEEEDLIEEEEDDSQEPS